MYFDLSQATIVLHHCVDVLTIITRIENEDVFVALPRVRLGAYRLRQKWRIPPHWITESNLSDNIFRHVGIIGTHLNVVVFIGHTKPNPNNNNSQAYLCF